MADKKLWVCSINIGIMVLAEDKDEAARVAASKLEEEVGNRARSLDEFIVSDAGYGKRKVYADKWDNDRKPYGTDVFGQTVGDLFKELEDNGWMP